ncbi:MAG: ApaG domain-containing protein [Opitutaceae bacterium]
MATESKELPGLRAKLDKLVYFHDSDKLPSDTPHAFIYFITISNLSDSTVTLRGRRWVLRDSNGHSHVIEGEGIVGKEPTLTPGESFTYNSYHMTHCDCIATGSFHGVDSSCDPIHLRIPEIEMKVPPQTPESNQLP